MLDVNRLRVIDAVARHGSVTAAAKELHYSQPSVTHHLAKLEAETGAQLLQKVGRGIRLTPAGQLLADRAAEIIGRVAAADAELSAHVGLNAGRVRLAGFASAISALVLPAVAALGETHPGLEVGLVDTHPPEAIELLRTGQAEVAIIFRYDDTEPEPTGVRLQHLLDDPLYLLSQGSAQTLEELRDATWVAGCERCRSHLLSLCDEAGFAPRIGYSSDDMVLMQALVAAGLGVTTMPGLALRVHRPRGDRGDRAARAPARLRRDLRRAAGPAGDGRAGGRARRGRRSARGRLIHAHHVARGVAHREVLRAPELLGRLLHDLRARVADLREGGVEVAGLEMDTGQRALGDEAGDGVEVGGAAVEVVRQHDRDVRLGGRADRDPAKAFIGDVVAHVEAERVAVEAQRFLGVVDDDEAL